MNAKEILLLYTLHYRPTFEEYIDIEEPEEYEHETLEISVIRGV